MTELFLLGFIHHLVIEDILEDVYTVLDNSHTGMRVSKNPPYFFYYPAVQQHRMVLRILWADTKEGEDSWEGSLASSNHPIYHVMRLEAGYQGLEV